MQGRTMGVILGVAMMLEMAASSVAQAKPAANVQHQSSLEVALSYNAAISQDTAHSSFWMQGGDVQIYGRVYGPVGIVADVSGLHAGSTKSSSSGTSIARLDLIVVTFGPRFTRQFAEGRYEFFGQGLVGVANGLHGVFPSPSGASSSGESMAVKAGGGVTVRLNRHLALRPIEINWFRTQLRNSTDNVQNNLALGTGIVARF